VFVYGDDLIVPHGSFPLLRDSFEPYGLRFSPTKCCISGKFRESCGLDAYAGVDVTPVRLRRPYGQAPGDLVSIVEHINMLMTRGYVASSRVLRVSFLRQFTKAKRMKIPFKDPLSTEIGFIDFDETPHPKLRMRHSCVESLVWTVVPKKTRCPEEDEPFYLREVLSHGGQLGELRLFKGRSERWLSLPRELRFKKRWLPWFGSTETAAASWLPGL
jgi:hypothetical protein